MKKVNLLILTCPELDNYPLIGGSEKAPYRTAKYLSREPDLEVKLFYFSGPPSTKNKILIHVPRLKLYLTTLIREIGVLLNWRSLSSADVIQIHHPHYALSFGVLRWITSSPIKLIVKAHGTAFLEFKSSKKKGLRGLILSLNNLIHLWHDRMALCFVDVCICSSEYQKEEMQKIYGVPEYKLVSIYNGYDPDFFPASGLVRNKKSMLMVARPVPKKNLQYAVDLLNKLRLADSEFTLTIVAGSRIRLEDFQTSLYLSEIEKIDAIKVLYDLPEDDLAKIYAQSNFFLLPSVEYESIPSVLYEAMVSGCRIFSAYKWGIPEVLPESVALNFNLDQDAEMILHAKSEQLPRQSEQFSYENIAKLYKELYD